MSEGFVWSVWSIRSIWFIRLGWFNQTNETDQINQTDLTGLSLLVEEGEELWYDPTL